MRVDEALEADPSLSDLRRRVGALLDKWMWRIGSERPAAAYYDQIRSLERDLVHAARADDVDKLQQVLADGETDLPKMQPPAWARTDHARLTHEWAQLASDLANARDEPGGGFESDVAADVRQINVTTADLATAVTAHRP
jgi:hypothetical protein